MKPLTPYLIAAALGLTLIAGPVAAATKATAASAQKHGAVHKVKKKHKAAAKAHKKVVQHRLTLDTLRA